MGDLPKIAGHEVRILADADAPGPTGRRDHTRKQASRSTVRVKRRRWLRSNKPTCSGSIGG